MQREALHGWRIAGPSPRPDDTLPWLIARTGSHAPEDEANARLIAAAPELLAESSAAETMLSELLAALNKATELGATRVDVGDLRVAVEHRLKPLRAAIAKAEIR
jgi:hypothetical protein